MTAACSTGAYLGTAHMAETDDRPAFTVDAMLGRLARALRMLGSGCAPGEDRQGEER